MPSRRWLNFFSPILITGMLLVVGVAAILIYEIEQRADAAKLIVRDDLWVVYQFQLEHQRLLSAAYLAKHEDGDEPLKALALRLDIFASRLKIISESSAAQQLVDYPDFLPLIQDAEERLAEADRVMAAADSLGAAAAGQKISAIMEPLGAPVLNLMAYTVTLRDSYADKYMHTLTGQLDALMILASLTVLASIGLMLQNRRLRRQGADLRHSHDLTQASYQAVREREADLRLVLDNLPVLLANIGRDLRFRFVNQVAARWYGKPASDLAGTHVADLFLPDHLNKLRPLMDQALSGQPAGFDGEIDYPDGKRRWIELRYIPDRAGDGSVRGFLAVVVDMSAHRAMEHQLAQAQKMEALGQLTGGVAHDFNNLLGIVVGNLDLLIDRLGADNSHRQLLERTIAAAQRGSALTQHLLAFARRQHLKPCATDVGALIGDIVALLPRLLGGNVEVVTTMEPGLWHCLVDPGQLESAIVNLSINARDAMPDGGRLTISSGNVSFADEAEAAQFELSPGRYIVITVADTGSGMTPDIARHAFDPFFTTKAEGKGSGLGLSMVYGFVKQSGGGLGLDTQLGEGTRMRLFLPRAETLATAAPVVPDAAPASAAHLILVVEDNAEVRQFAVDALRVLGHQSLEAPDAACALKLLAEIPSIDLMLTDIRLGAGLDGFELAEIAIKARPRLRIVYMTGFADSSKKIKVEAPMLPKPFRKADLEAALHQALAGKAQPILKRTLPFDPVG